MPQNFLACDREQELLLPPSLREWLAEDHFAWFVIEAVGELDLAAFFAAYRADGHGRAAHDSGDDGGADRVRVRDRRALVAADRAALPRGRRVPGDHGQPGARSRHDRAFRVRHEHALSELFGQVLGLCADAGLMRVGVVAVDGTKGA
jgi:hypothetical protein